MKEYWNPMRATKWIDCHQRTRLRFIQYRKRKSEIEALIACVAGVQRSSVFCPNSLSPPLPPPLFTPATQAIACNPVPALTLLSGSSPSKKKPLILCNGESSKGAYNILITKLGQTGLENISLSCRCRSREGVFHPHPRDEAFIFVFMFKICLPHHSLCHSFNSGAPTPKKTPGSAIELG